MNKSPALPLEGMPGLNYAFVCCDLNRLINNISWRAVQESLNV